MTARQIIFATSAEAAFRMCANTPLLHAQTVELETLVGTVQFPCIQVPHEARQRPDSTRTLTQSNQLLIPRSQVSVCTHPRSLSNFKLIHHTRADPRQLPYFLVVHTMVSMVSCWPQRTLWRQVDGLQLSPGPAYDISCSPPVPRASLIWGSAATQGPEAGR